MTHQNRKQLATKINTYFEDCCFDIQGISGSQSVANLAEAQMAKILTKIVVGAASVWWSALELRDFLKNRRSQKGF